MLDRAGHCQLGGALAELLQSRVREPVTQEERNMRHARFTRLGQLVVFVGIVLPATLMAQTKYSVVTLDGLGGTAGAANSINNRAGRPARTTSPVTQFRTLRCGRADRAPSISAVSAGREPTARLRGRSRPTTASLSASPTRRPTIHWANHSLLALLRVGCSHQEDMPGLQVGERRDDAAASVPRRLQQLRHCSE